MAHEELTDRELAQVALAAELRRCMHLVVGRTIDTEELARATTALRTVGDRFEQAPEYIRGSEPWKPPSELEIPGDGEPFPDSLERPVSGAGNPFSIPMTVYRQGDQVVTAVTLDAGFEGAPGRSHGGFVAAIFDDLFGSLPLLRRTIAFTASLTVNYVGPSPVRAPVTFRGWIERIEGKKIFIAGDAYAGDELVTTASALFIDASDYIAQRYGQSE